MATQPITEYQEALETAKKIVKQINDYDILEPGAAFEEDFIKIADTMNKLNEAVQKSNVEG